MDAIWMTAYDPSTSPPTPVGPFLRGRPCPPGGWRDCVYHVVCSDGIMMVATVARNGDNDGRFVTMPPGMKNR